MIQLTLDIKNKKKDEAVPGSINYLLKLKSNQGVFIQFGNKIENVLRDFSKFCGLEHLNESGKKIGKTQVDYLVKINRKLKYAELKGFAGLDSEKLPATFSKIIKMKEMLGIRYPEISEDKIELNFFHVSSWDEEYASKHHKNTYSFMKKNGIKLMFMSDYFKDLGVDMTKEMWEQIWNECSEIITS